MNEESPSWEVDEEFDAIDSNVDFDAEENLELLHRKKILIIEDCHTQQKLYEHMLKKLSTEVSLVETGDEAVELLKNDQFDYDAIILDYFMPGLNGMETAKALRELGYTAPIIGMTANYDEVDKYKWFIAGCDVILKKPITREQFIKHLSYSFALNHNGQSNE